MTEPYSKDQADPRPGPFQQASSGPVASSVDGDGRTGSPGHSEAVTGPFTVRDIAVFASVFVMLVGSVLPFFIVRGFVGNLWNSVSLFFLGIGILLPLVVVVLFAFRRLRPASRLRVGSLSVDQFASVVAVLAFTFFFLQTVSSYSVGALVALVGSFGLLGSTTAAPHLPRFAADFAGRQEIPAHVVARDAVPAQPKPGQPRAGAAAKTGAAAKAPHGHHHEFVKHDRPVQPHPSPSQQGSIPVDAYQVRHPHEHHAHGVRGKDKRGAGSGTAAGATAAGAAVAGAAGAAEAGHKGAGHPDAHAHGGERQQQYGQAFHREHEAGIFSDQRGTPATDSSAPLPYSAEEDFGPEEVLFRPAGTAAGTAAAADERAAGTAAPAGSVASAPVPGAVSGGAAPTTDQEARPLPAESREQGPSEGTGRGTVVDATAVDLPRVEQQSSESFSATMEAAEEEPVYEAFWVAVPEPRPVIDERTGAVIFTAEPGRWLLVLQDRGDEYLVKEQDAIDPATGQPIDGTGTGIGVMRNITNLERG